MESLRRKDYSPMRMAGALAGALGAATPLGSPAPTPIRDCGEPRQGASGVAA